MWPPNRSGDPFSLWKRDCNWLFIEGLQKKPREKAEYVLQSTTYVAFCNGDGRGESVDEVARRSNREIGNSIAILKGQSTITHDLVDFLLQPMNCLRSVQRDRTLARNGINAPALARFA